MPVSQEQIAKEKAAEAKLNKLSDQVIGKTAWGQFYGLMKMAAKTAEANLPHKICVSKDGREIKVYKGAGKLVGSFLKPTNEYVTKYVSQGNYGMAIASAFGLAGQLQSIKDQKEANCSISVKPADIVNLVKAAGYDPNTGLRKTTNKPPPSIQSKPKAAIPQKTAPVIIGTSIVVTLVILIVKFTR